MIGDCLNYGVFNAYVKRYDRIANKDATITKKQKRAEYCRPKSKKIHNCRGMKKIAKNL